MTPEQRAARVLDTWHRQVIDTTTPFSGDDVLARDIAEAIREAVAERTQTSVMLANKPCSACDRYASGHEMGMTYCHDAVAELIRAQK